MDAWIRSFILALFLYPTCATTAIILAKTAEDAHTYTYTERERERDERKREGEREEDTKFIYSCI